LKFTAQQVQQEFNMGSLARASGGDITDGYYRQLKSYGFPYPKIKEEIAEKNNHSIDQRQREKDYREVLPDALH